MSNKKHNNRLSEHFSLDEMTYSRIAIENGLDNEPPPAARQALGNLANGLLEPLREVYKGPIAVLSGYRSEAVNRLAGGVATSQHLKGEAADCYVAEGPLRLLEALKSSGLPFDQAIVYAKRKFLHLSLKEVGCNRMQVLFYLFCLVFLLPACRIRRGSMKEEHAFHADSLVAGGFDSSFSIRKRCTLDSINWHLTRLILSPPDSTGRQYPAEIAWLKGDRRHIASDTTESTTTTALKATRVQTASSSVASQKEYKQSFPAWIWIAGAIVLLLLGGGMIRYFIKKDG